MNLIKYLGTYMKSSTGWVIVVSILLTSHATYAEVSTPNQRVLTLEEAVSAAMAIDPWLKSNKHSQEALENESISARELPDPQLAINVANLPTDTFDINQEGMTQFKFELKQMFPAGDSLALKGQQLMTLAGQHPYQRANRKAKVTVMVSLLWLEAYKAQASAELIHKNHNLFEQMEGIAASSYSAAMGRTRQQDVIRAQVELTRLNDRLTKLSQMKDMATQRLSEWVTVPEEWEMSAINSNPLISVQLPAQLPNIPLHVPAWFESSDLVSYGKLVEAIQAHPAILAMDQQIKAHDQGIELAKQKYKPSWGVGVGYALRDDDPMGNNRADLFSVGVNFDLPFFTKNRQDQGVKAAVSKTEAMKAERLLMMRGMIASFGTQKSQLARLTERQRTYRDLLLPQMAEQADASLTAYTHDDGDFAEVVRSRIAVLNAEIEALDIDVEKQKSIAQLNYFFQSGQSSELNQLPGNDVEFRSQL